MTEYDFESNCFFELSSAEIRRVAEWIPYGIRFVDHSGVFAFLRIARYDLVLEKDMPVNKLMLYEIVIFGWHACQSALFTDDDINILMKCLDFLTIDELIFLGHQIHNIWKD